MSSSNFISLTTAFSISLVNELSKHYEKFENIINLLQESFKKINEKALHYGMNIEEELSILMEHDIWKLKQILLDYDIDYDTFFEKMTDFANKYPDEVKRYCIVYLACLILLLAILKVSKFEILFTLVKMLRKYAEELEGYLVTFDLLINPLSEEDLQTAGEFKSISELKRFLNLEESKYT